MEMWFWLLGYMLLGVGFLAVMFSVDDEEKVSRIKELHEDTVALVMATTLVVLFWLPMFLMALFFGTPEKKR